MRQESPYLSAFSKHIAFIQQQQNQGVNKSQLYREAHPYNIMVIQSHMLSKQAIVKSIQIKTVKFLLDKNKQSFLDWISKPNINITKKGEFKYAPDDDDDKGENTDWFN